MSVSVLSGFLEFPQRFFVQLHCHLLCSTSPDAKVLMMIDPSTLTLKTFGDLCRSLPMVRTMLLLFRRWRMTVVIPPPFSPSIPLSSSSTVEFASVLGGIRAGLVCVPDSDWSLVNSVVVLRRCRRETEYKWVIFCCWRLELRKGVRVEVPDLFWILSEGFMISSVNLRQFHQRTRNL